MLHTNTLTRRGLIACYVRQATRPRVNQFLRSEGYTGAHEERLTVDRDQLYVELNKLSADEIEAGLDAGVWSGDRRQLVEHYLDQLQVTTMQMEAAEAAKVAAQLAERQSSRATSLATAALIVAVGAMIAAVASAFVAFLGLQN